MLGWNLAERCGRRQLEVGPPHTRGLREMQRGEATRTLCVYVGACSDQLTHDCVVTFRGGSMQWGLAVAFGESVDCLGLATESLSD